MWDKRMGGLRPKLKWIAVGQLALLAALLAVLLAQRSGWGPVDLSVEDLASEYVTYRAGEGWVIDHEQLPEGLSFSEGARVLEGPYVPLARGSYTLELAYSTDATQTMKLSDHEGKNKYLLASPVRLDEHQHVLRYSFTLTEDVQDFGVVFLYNGTGVLKVSGLSVTPNGASFGQALVGLFLLFLVFDLLAWNWKAVKSNKKLVGCLAGTVLLSSLPLFGAGFNQGHDIYFHLLRIEGIAQSLRDGAFPVRIGTTWLAGFGYPVSLYYADVFLYLPALLRLAGFPILRALKIYILCCNAATAVLATLCFEKIFRDRNVALLTAFVYLASSYRLVNVYIRAAVGEFSAMAFLPLVALAMFRLFTWQPEDGRTWPRDGLLLALGMTGLIQTHVLSVEMTVFVLVIFCLLLWRKTFRGNSLLGILSAVGETVLLNLFFLVPFLDYYTTVDACINQTVEGEAVKTMQRAGVQLVQLFAFDQSPSGNSSIHLPVRMAMTPGLLLMAGLVAAVTLWAAGKAERPIKVLTVFSCIAIFLSTDLFPWNSLAYRTKLGDLLSQVQFPWRYLSLAVLVLSLLFGFVVLRLTPLFRWESGKACLALGVAAAVCCCMFVSRYADVANIIYVYDLPEIDTFSNVSGGEYLRAVDSSSGMRAQSGELQSEGLESAEIVTRRGVMMVVSAKAGADGGELILPVTNYKGYHAFDQDGAEVEIFEREDPEVRRGHQIRISVPAGYEGTFTLRFVEPWYWGLAEGISLLAWAALAVLLLTWRSKSKKARKRRTRKKAKARA